MTQDILGSGSAIQEAISLIDQVADSNVTVLITGESGTGKEMAANAIHEKSRRKKKPYLKMNCAAIPTELLESQMFGHEKGAFTGAIARQEGCFERADGGTLFFDEIGDMSLITQAKLLRVLQDQKFERIGGSESIRTDVRIISATNKELADEISRGNFREDLYYRLNVVEIHMPPLRERMEDLPQLVDSFIQEFKQKYGKMGLKVSQEAMYTLLNYSWPGNVRELRNVIERAAVLVRDEIIKPEDLPEKISKPSAMPADFPEEGKILTLAEMEKIYVRQVLEYTGGNKLRAAKLLKIDPKTLRSKLAD
ncbi:MAG: sigma-54-dependent Fis family transcriptional regulator [Candidatus Riflebacteria bacterium]|nr:sigma-54-dependent Fis family transcriptional regulator [Candidatus Riflebacteria bacterium]